MYMYMFMFLEKYIIEVKVVKIVIILKKVNENAKFIYFIFGFKIEYM